MWIGLPCRVDKGDAVFESMSVLNARREDRAELGSSKRSTFSALALPMPQALQTFGPYAPCSLLQPAHERPD